MGWSASGQLKKSQIWTFKDESVGTRIRDMVFMKVLLVFHWALQHAVTPHQATFMLLHHATSIKVRHYRIWDRKLVVALAAHCFNLVGVRESEHLNLWRKAKGKTGFNKNFLILF